MNSTLKAKNLGIILFRIFTFTLITCTFGHAQSVYKVIFASGLTEYYSALILYENGPGKMRTKYYGEECKCTKTVEQTMKAENTTEGFRLTGYNPVYPGTNEKYPKYSADNFYVLRDYKGNLKITNIDNQGIKANTKIELIPDEEIYDFLREFNWKLQDN